MSELLAAENQLGAYLRDRRTRLDPAAFGFPAERRRTPGLRREEVAQRANISPTWYTWLEQGRGGAPSPDVLDRIARGEVVKATDYYFRIAAQFETASEKYGWLNNIISVGVGHRLPEGPIYRMFEVL